MLGAILTAPYLLQGSANRAASEMSHRSDHPRKSTCTQVSRNNGRSHGPTRKASNQASNETMKRKPSRTVQTVVYSKDARDRSFYRCKSWSLVPPKTAWLWWSMHAGAARLMGSVYPGSSMEFNRPSSCCATCSKHHVPDLPVSLLFLNDRSRLEPDPGGEIVSRPELSLQIGADGFTTGLHYFCIDQKETKRDESEAIRLHHPIYGGIKKQKTLWVIQRATMHCIVLSLKDGIQGGLEPEPN